MFSGINISSLNSTVRRPVAWIDVMFAVISFHVLSLFVSCDQNDYKADDWLSESRFTLKEKFECSSFELSSSNATVNSLPLTALFVFVKLIDPTD